MAWNIKEEDLQWCFKGLEVYSWLLVPEKLAREKMEKVVRMQRLWRRKSRKNVTIVSRWYLAFTLCVFTAIDFNRVLPTSMLE